MLGTRCHHIAVANRLDWNEFSAVALCGRFRYGDSTEAWSRAERSGGNNGVIG
jgi:hypothetical protein